MKIEIAYELWVLWRSLDVFSKFFSSSFFSLEHSKLTACFFSGWLALTEKSWRTKKSQVNFIWKAFQNSNPFFRFNSCFCHFSHLVSTCLLNFFFFYLPSILSHEGWVSKCIFLGPYPHESLIRDCWQWVESSWPLQLSDWSTSSLSMLFCCGSILVEPGKTAAHKRHDLFHICPYFLNILSRGSMDNI